MKTGFIGLGNLGTPIAENLLQKGYKLYVYNRTASKAQPFAEKGATICSSVKELASACDVVFSIVSDDTALNHITHGTEGIAANLKPGGIHISVSTILPETATQLDALHQQYNNHYIAAPVMGRPEAARLHKLNFLVSGNAAAIAIIKTVLQDAGAANVWEFGTKTSASNVAKLCSNYLIISAIQAMSEGIHLAKQSGIDPDQWMSVLTQTLFAAYLYQLRKHTFERIISTGSFQFKAWSERR